MSSEEASPGRAIGHGSHLLGSGVSTDTQIPTGWGPSGHSRRRMVVTGKVLYQGRYSPKAVGSIPTGGPPLQTPG